MLQQAAQAAAAASAPKRGEREAAPAPVDTSQMLSQMGQVNWEAQFVKARQVKNDGEVEFRLPSLPKPLKMRFLIDSPDTLKNWTDLSAGKAVKFVGRFESATPKEIVMRVRLAEPAVSDNPLDSVLDEQR